MASAPDHRDPRSAPACRRRCSAGRGCGPCCCCRRRWRWFVLIYLAALVLLFISSLWTVEPFTGKHRPHLDARTTSRRSIDDTGLPHDRAAHDRHRGGGDGDRRGARRARSPSSRCASRRSGCAGRAVRGRPDPAVVELPGAGLRVAADPRPRRRPELDARADRSRPVEHRLLQLGDLDRVQLHLAAVHDPAGLGGARARPRFLPRGLGRPRRARLADVPLGAAAADPAGRSSPARSSPSR